MGWGRGGRGQTRGPRLQSPRHSLGGKQIHRLEVAFLVVAMLFQGQEGPEELREGSQDFQLCFCSADLESWACMVSICVVAAATAVAADVQ